MHFYMPQNLKHSSSPAIRLYSALGSGIYSSSILSAGRTYESYPYHCNTAKNQSIVTLSDAFKANLNGHMRIQLLCPVFLSIWYAVAEIKTSYTLIKQSNTLLRQLAVRLCSVN